MNNYEKAFVTKMGRLTDAGIDLEALAREALMGKFGGATEVLFRGFSVEALKDPERFVKELSRIFGMGAMGICEPIVKYADLGLYGSGGDSPVLEMLRQLGPATGQIPVHDGILLHDYRIKDEAGNYPDNAD